MGSNGKKKTTMAKITRENRMRERRADKQARKDARKASGERTGPIDTFSPVPVFVPAEED